MIHQLITTCNFEGAHWLFFGPNVPPLIYYSHIPNIIIAVLLGLFILFNNRKSLPNRILFFTILAFETWVFFALIFWATNRADVVMFAWLMDILVEPLVYIGALYLLYVLIDKKDISFRKKIFLGVLYLPIVIFLPTDLMLSGFNVTTCLANEGPLALYYTYAVEVIVGAWAILLCLRRYFSAGQKERRKEILFLSVGTMLFLIAFAWGNIIGSFTENWQLGDYGLFGMPIFIGFLVYSIVKFRTFNIKLIAAQALVVALLAVVGSEFAFVQNSVNYWLVSISFALVAGGGFFLVRSVKREIEQREHIEQLAKELQAANEKLKELDRLKSQFLSMASHDLRAPLTIIRNFVSLILEGAYGKLASAGQEGLQQVFDRATDMAKSVETYLDVSRIEQGRMKYDFIEIELLPMIQNAVKAFTAGAEAKGLKLTATYDPALEKVKAKIDVAKMNEILNNLLDNTIKYTPKGEINISVKKIGAIVRFQTQDTGVGMTPTTLKNLFQLFSPGEDSKRINPASTGVGLYVTKAHVEAHKGKIWAESEGAGKGSRFIMELPLL
jgi:signal transduction histidine kinase